MTKPIILANESLVLNGDFEQSLTHWKKGPLNPAYLGTKQESYEGVPIRFLNAGNESSVSQPLLVPKNPGATARYVLSFLCEVRHTLAGTLVVSIDGQPDNKLIIELTPGPPRDLKKDEARRKRGQPLVFVPNVYECPLDLPFTDQDTLTVRVNSPKNDPGDYTSAVCITRIKLHLHLEPVVMQTLKLDQETLPATGPLHLCLGATASLFHSLAFVPEPDNAWLGTQAALTIHDNPQGAVVATPAWEINQPVDLPWTLDCPLIGDEEPYLFSMNLLNQFTAEPYPVQVSLGHHRLVFSEVLEAAYYPVLEYGQSVRLGVQVASYYNGQPLSGRTVNWTLKNQQVKGAAVTNEAGWAYFDYPSTQAGDFDIEASVESLYYAARVVTQTLVVRVLATDPWKDVLAVVEDIEARWEEKTGYPNRGSDYPVNLKLPAASPLQGTELSLHWSGDSPEQLGVAVSPALEAPVPVNGVALAWNLKSEDRLDGRFNLQLVCSKLLLPSLKKTMSLARNLVKIGEVREANKFPVVDESERVLLRVQVVHFIVSGNGDPVVNALVEWTVPDGPSTIARTGMGGWASVLYTPKSAGDKVVTARIKAHAEAVAVEQPFKVQPIATSPWKSEVKILLDGVEVERNTIGVLCRRGQIHTLKVEPVTGSAWIGKNISLHWRGVAPDIGLVPSDLATPKPLVAAGVEWKLVSQTDTSISSLFELELRLASVTPVRELSGRLVSVDLTEEVSLRLDQIPAALDAQTLYPCLGALHRFSVLPNALSPLVGLESSLTWSGTSAEELGATVQPAFNLAQPINDGGATWTLDFTASQQSGQFALAWALPQLGFVGVAKPMALAHNKLRIEAWRESPVDPVVGQDPAWLWVRVFSHYTGLAVNGVPVTWTAGESSEVLTDAKGWSGLPVAPAIAGPQAVKALVISAYDGYEDARSLEVTALASDPWAGLMVKFDGATAQPWGEKTYFPRRKGEHTFELLAAENSPLFDRELTLGMTGTGPAELGIKFVPDALGVAREFYNVGLLYTFKTGDLKDGSFALRLASQRLASLSPANAMSLGEGSQVMSIIWDSRTFQTVDWEQELVEGVTVISTITGKPMAGVPVTWRSPDIGVVTSVTDFYGVAQMRFVPSTPGAAELTATVGDGESVASSYFLNEPREIAALTSPKPNGQVGERVSAVVNVVSAMTGEPLQDVEVMWDYPDRVLAPTKTDAEGNARVEFRMPGIRIGLLEATVLGGYAGWEVKSIEFKLVPNLSAFTTSSTWLQEFTPYVGEKKVRWPDLMLNLVAGDSCIFMLDYEYSWLIGDPDAFLTLEYKPGAEGQGLVFDPPLGQLCEMAEGTTFLSWSITTDQAHSGPVILQFGIPGIAEISKSPPVPGEMINIAQEVDVTFDQFPVTFEKGAAAYPCHGATHTITVLPKPSSRLLNKPLQLLWNGGTTESLGVVVRPSLEGKQTLTEEGVTWELDCLTTSNKGEFFLQLIVDGYLGLSQKLNMSLGHNLVTATRWTSGPFGVGDGYYLSNILATSFYLGVPASGVQVSAENSAYSGYTGANGTDSALSTLRLKIVNRYDGSVV
ncbi:Ig-like domain-containing protein [Pseudomonas khorasanensis]|uniref:Ig-like domain-containing protein n=1 Tax=Pseudomonas khorasanensis TaxID=2745508 RepID=UPI001CEC622E|nr:Ig-like domain-containing protein [Pseudomonas khorasanensis]